MNGNDDISKLLAKMYVDYMLSDEKERILNPERNDKKYADLQKSWLQCAEIAAKYKGKIEGQNPNFPCSCHLIKLVFPTENDEIVLREIKSNLAETIEVCDEVNLDTDIKGNVEFYFGFENVYTEGKS